MEAKAAEKKILQFIRSCFVSSKRKVAIVGLSGGLDSAVTIALCCRALGPRRVLAAILPLPSTPRQDVQDAILLARKLGVKTEKLGIGRIVSSFGRYALGRLERANVSARVRMAILYSLASRHNGLVVGTGDKSELLLGYFTKYGDGAADILPLGGLYKTQVRELAASMGIPRRILQKPSSPALWKGQTAEAELGFAYRQADAVLMAIERGEKRGKLEKKFGKRLVSAVVLRVEKSRHKRLPPPICSL